MSVAVVGHRSWLASPIAAEFTHRGITAHVMSKREAVDGPLGRFDAVILIAGRARPTRDDIQLEIGLVAGVCENRSQPRRLIYISSAMVDRWERDSRPLSPSGEQYVLAKKHCETIVCGQPMGRRKAPGYAIRLPVIFGPGQPLDSDMLVPMAMTARLTNGMLRLRQPLEPFELVHVGDAAKAIADLASDPDPLPIRSVRSDLHQPLRIASVIAPGVQTFLEEGWRWTTVGRPEPGQRHVTEVTYQLKEQDLISTAAWYEQNRMLALEPFFRAQERFAIRHELALGTGIDKDVIDI